MLFSILIHTVRIIRTIPRLYVFNKTRNLSSGGVMKPVNILIKTDSYVDYRLTYDYLASLLLDDTYTVYQLNQQNFSKGLWMDSCAILFYCRNSSLTINNDGDVNGFLEDYLKLGNIILYGEEGEDSLISAMFTRLTLKTETCPYEMFSYTEKEGCIYRLPWHLTSSNKEDINNILKKSGIKVKKNTDVKQCEVITQRKSPAYLFSYNTNTKITDLFELLNDEGFYIKFQESLIRFYNTDVELKNDAYIQIITDTNKSISFNSKLYFTNLESNTYGKNIIYTDIIDSTQNIFISMKPNVIKCDGLLVTARQQTSGKGRGENQWLSPIGCMMFSLNISIDLNSNLGRNLPFIQHLVVAAFVHSIRTQQGYGCLQLNIKWPNDIYIGRCKKIGGVIVNSVLFDNKFKVTVGLGVNIDNEAPTVCLNSYIREWNMNQSAILNELAIEEALARTVNTIEKFVDLFQSEGVDALKEIYYKYWLHSNTSVSLESYNNEKATIVGVDDIGYLRVKLTNGDYVSLQPDGNSFDMSKNMIVMK